MAIVKAISSRATTSSNEDDEGPMENDEEYSSGASDSSNGSDLLDVGEKGTELCSVGDQNCSIPYELFDLLDLRPILSLESWNYCLTEEERFSLSAYLPDMDQSTFVRTLKELLAGENFHFGNPLFELYDRLKGGLCQPEVARYREGLEFLQRKEHYHFLRKYQSTMVNNLLEMRETWEHCRNLGMEEKLKIWKSEKHQKAFHAQEVVAMPSFEGEYVQKRMSGRLSIHLSKTPKVAEDEKMVDVDPSLGKVKGPSTKLGGRYSSAAAGNVVLSKGPLELCTGVLEPEEINTIQKQLPRRVLKISKNGKTEMRLESGQVSSYSEMQDFETKSKSKVNKWEVDDRVEVTSITRGKTRSRTINRLETEFEKMQRHQSCNYLNENVGLVKSGVHNHRKFGRLKEQHISGSAYVQIIPKNGQFWKVNNHSGGNRNLEDFKKRGKISAAYVRGDMQEMSRRRLHTPSFNDLRKYNRDRDICAEDQEPNSDKKKGISLDFHRNRTNQWQEPIDRDTEQPFEQEMILNDKKLNYKEAEIHERKKGKADYQKNLDQLKKRNTEINHSSKDLFGFPAKQEILSDEDKLENQAICLEGHSELVETSRYASHISLSLDNLKKSHEGKKKKRKKRQIDDVLTFDLEKQHEESSSDSFKEGTETPKGFEGPQQCKDVMKFGKTNSKNIKNGSLTSLCHRSSEATVSWKKSKKNVESDVDVLDCGISNGSHVDAQPTLGIQARDIKPLKKKDKKTLKKDADIFTGSTELDRSPNNPCFRSCQQVGVLKPGKKGATKKLEDSKSLDGRVESNRIAGSPQFTLSSDSDELKAVNREAKKVTAESEILNGVPELNTLQCNESPCLYQQVDEGKPGKKRTRKKMEDNTGCLLSLPSRQASIADKVTSDAKASKKSSPLVMPPVVSSFSFSVIHFLSAVRTAMLSPSAEDISEVVNQYEKRDGERESSNQEGELAVSCEGKVEEQNSVIPNHPLECQPDACRGGSFSRNVECERQATPYSIPFQEIVKLVETNPGDPCVLKIQEPLQDLVRGALKIFASKIAPQGAKGWKPLAVYDKSTRVWSWIGPIPSRSLRHQVPEAQTSESWGISQKMLLKLVETFANWLKNGQETLQQIVLLPSPPPPLMSTCMDEKERFRDLRAQKSSITIAPSSSDMRAYFRREEVLRYSVPDRAFAYTAADGRKAVVAPLRRCGGKPTSKARDHFMLKTDRPPHVTILCLVRDAAARLPGSIGTRADVCTLIRDSQYIVEDVSDAQINQVVSGALDRLHYERDPCVQFDGERKLWVYLHTERDEEDFEDDGTSSTKRWKRPKKENVDNPDPGLFNDSAYHSVDDQDACGSGLGFDFCRPDYNADSSSIYSCGKAELVYNRNGSLTSPRVLRIFNESNLDDGMVPFIEIPPSMHSIPGSMHESHPMGWEVLGQNPLGHGLNLQSQKPTSNGDLNNGTSSREAN